VLNCAVVGNSASAALLQAKSDTVFPASH